MDTIPAPTYVSAREEWTDADFDLPEGEPLHHDTDAECNKGDDDDEDWDLEMDFGKTGGAKAQAVFAGRAARSKLSDGPSQIINIRPPAIFDEDEEDEGTSTIRATTVLKPPANPLPPAIEDDFEDAFALPSDLTQLSLAPLSLNHRSSKNSLEWGDKDQTSSSQSSDAYSSFSFADTSPSSNSASSVSQPGSGAEDEDDDCELEGLVIPTSLFESVQGAKQLNRILEMKKNAQIVEDRVKIASPDVEDDFEMGLVIDDDVDLSPSRLMLNNHQKRSKGSMKRSESLPARPSLPSISRPKDRAKSPINPPQSSMRQFQKLRLSPSPPLCPITRSQTFQPLASPPPPLSVNFLTPKTTGLRNQKSHSGLKPPTPPSTLRKLSRKASLSSLFEATQLHASGSSSGSSNKPSRYGAPTAASRARTHTSSTGRISSSEFTVPPTRPSTPSSNPAALRLTMPTLSRTKLRVPLSAVFGASPTVSPNPRPHSPLPPRPPSASSRTHTLQRPSNSQPPAKVLRRPKRQRLYGDGTELDGIDDLPTDRDKETRFRVQPKSYGNRVPGGTYFAKSFEKDATRKKGRRNDSTGSNGSNALAPATNTLKRTARIEFTPVPDVPSGKKKNTFPQGHSRRKPTLIRNLSGASAPKVVGDMKWNPLTLRWEGNENVLRDFDVAVGTSTRPALITQLTGSSMGSPANSFASGARIVGNMIFDPTRMCWISTLPPEEDEPDVFADLADDEEEGDGWETKGGTIRPNPPQGLSSSDTSTSSLDVEASPASSHSKNLSESGSDRGSRASMVCDVDESFWETCRVAEERHRFEMKWWKLKPTDTFSGPDRSSLYEIRALATRKYGS